MAVSEFVAVGAIVQVDRDFATLMRASQPLDRQLDNADIPVVCRLQRRDGARGLTVHEAAAGDDEPGRVTRHDACGRQFRRRHPDAPKQTFRMSGMGQLQTQPHESERLLIEMKNA